MPERHTIMLLLTDEQVRLLRQAAYDYADRKYAMRMERLARPEWSRSDLHPSHAETTAWELLRRVDKATGPFVEEVSHVPNV